MSTRSRAIVAASSLLLGLLFVLPIWTITLEAPQYPEGIGMRIWIDTVTGVKQHDLQNINGLNHYIGMAPIEPDAIPELMVMPWLFGGLILLGLAAAGTGSRRLLWAWVAILAVAAVVGLADFWWWEYTYGHNLDPDAAIKVPGMTYQPPFIGSKVMLNITAHSWPGPGMLAAAVATLGGVYVLYTERRRTPRPAPGDAPTDS